MMNMLPSHIHQSSKTMLRRMNCFTLPKISSNTPIILKNIQSSFLSTAASASHQTPKNPGLASVKEQGLTVLQSTTADIISKTKRRLLLSDEDTGPTANQLREAARLKILVEDAVEKYTSHKGGLFCMMNEPIAIIDVEITEDLRQARVYWTLPYSVLLMDVSSDVRARAIKRMQTILEERGGVLQGIVHQKLRSYYRAPKIRFVTAEGEMLRSVLKELL